MKTPSDREVSVLDVYQEFDAIRSKHNIGRWLSKGTVRKYAFELPGVPSEATYLKAAYPFSSEYPFFSSCKAIFTSPHYPIL